MANTKKLKIISGNGKNLKISTVKDHLDIEKPKKDEFNKDKIIIPTGKKKKK